MVEATFCAAQVTAGLKEGAALFVFLHGLVAFNHVEADKPADFHEREDAPAQRRSLRISASRASGIGHLSYAFDLADFSFTFRQRLPAPVSSHASCSDFENK